MTALSGKDFLTNNLILLELKKTNQPSKYANSEQSQHDMYCYFKGTYFLL